MPARAPVHACSRSVPNRTVALSAASSAAVRSASGPVRVGRAIDASGRDTPRRGRRATSARRAPCHRRRWPCQGRRRRACSRAQRPSATMREHERPAWCAGEGGHGGIVDCRLQIADFAITQISDDGRQTNCCGSHGRHYRQRGWNSRLARRRRPNLRNPQSAICNLQFLNEATISYGVQSSFYPWRPAARRCRRAAASRQRQGRSSRQSHPAASRRGHDLPWRGRLCRDGRAAGRQRAAVEAQLHPARPARAGQDANAARAGRAARRVDSRRRGLRAARRPVQPAVRRVPREAGRQPATTCPSSGCRAKTATSRSWRRPT